MEFACQGKTYDRSELAVFETGDPAVPRAYLTPDLRCVFVETVDPYKGTRIHVADAVEIKALAARYNLPELLRAK